MKTVVRVLPPGRLDSARSYIFCDDEFGSGYMFFHPQHNVSPSRSRPGRQRNGLAQVYSKNTAVPMMSTADMDGIRAGNPTTPATTRQRESAAGRVDQGLWNT